MARHTLGSLLGLGLVLVLTAPVQADTTVRVRGATGTGYTDETTNHRGTVVRRQTHSESGRLEKDTRYDPETGAPSGSVEYEYDAEGRLTQASHHDGEGTPQKTEHFDGSGRLVRRDDFDADGAPTGSVEWTFDADGRLVQVSFKDGRGSIVRSYHYRWQDGRLVDVSVNDETGGTLGHASYRDDGSLEELRGDVAEALRELGRAVDPHTHVTQGPAGETILVRHEADGTVDVTILFSDGRVGHVWLRHGEGCYLGDHCPFKDAAKAPEKISDPSKGMRPPRTGGLPADVLIPVPRPEPAPGPSY